MQQRVHSDLWPIVDSEIRVPSSGSAGIYLHEVLHRVQATDASAPDRVGGNSVRHRADNWDYLTARTHAMGTRAQIAPLTSRLADIQRGWGYEKNEITIPDEFPDPYYGKLYGGDYTSVYNELLTMAAQDLYYHPEQLGKDPRTRNWILGLLAAT